MSSILDALKRVEADRAENAPDGPGPAPSSRWMAQPETPQGWADRFWAARTAAGCIPPLAVMVLAAAAGLLAWHWGRRPLPAPEKAAPLEPPPVLSLNTAGQPAGGGPPPPARTTPAAPSTPLSAPEKALPPFRQIVKATGASAETRPARHTGPKGDVLKPPARPRSKWHPQHESPPVKDENEVGLSGKALPVPLPAAAGLRLQAVSWAEAPDRRIAVIDNRILHIGDAVNEFTMVDIEPGAAILSRQGVDYRLEFVPR